MTLTRCVLRIQNEHFVQRPTFLSDQLVVLCVVSPFPFPSDKDSVVKEYEAHCMVYFVRRRVKGDYVIDFGYYMAAGRSWNELGRSFDLHVEGLHLIRVEDSKVRDRGADVATTL